MILSSDKSSERNLSCFFDIIKPRRLEHLQSEEPFSSDPYFNTTPIFIYSCLSDLLAFLFLFLLTNRCVFLNFMFMIPKNIKFKMVKMVKDYKIKLAKCLQDLLFLNLSVISNYRPSSCNNKDQKNISRISISNFKNHSNFSEYFWYILTFFDNVNMSKTLMPSFESSVLFTKFSNFL